jgi:carbonic anhydrase
MHTPHDTSAPSANEALARLVAGNDRFVHGKTHVGGVPREKLADLAKAQRPYATILGCSDSRVPPEWVFDAGLGELFVVRVAGNVFSPEIAGSLQYAGSHLQTPLFVVLGHEACGAVQAALSSKRAGIQHRSRIQILVDRILPALPDFEPEVTPQAQLARAIESNVRWTVRQIIDSPEGKARVAEGRMKIVGAVYEIESGRVRFLADEGNTEELGARGGLLINAVPRVKRAKRRSDGSRNCG